MQDEHDGFEIIDALEFELDASTWFDGDARSTAEGADAAFGLRSVC